MGWIIPPYFLDRRKEVCMAPENESGEEKARKGVEELFKIVIATSGILLALLWGLTQRNITAGVLTIIRITSIVFVVSIFFSLLGYQFIITALENNIQKITKQRGVAVNFLVAWISFMVGCSLLLIAIFVFS